jgi:hypothetical protein
MAVDQDVLNVRLPKDLSAAIKQAAELEERSVNGQIIVYLRRCLVADGHYQSSAVPARPVVVAPPAAEPLHPTPVAPLPPQPASVTPQQRRTVPVSVALAAIGAGLREEQGRPLGSQNTKTLRIVLEAAFPDVVDLPSARAIGSDAWIKAGAGQALMKLMYPDDPDAAADAERARNADQRARVLRQGGELGQFIAEKKLFAGAAINFRTLMEGRFAGMSIAEAVALGPDPWLDAGVSADVALRIFGERTALEAKLRAQDRSRASRRKG